MVSSATTQNTALPHALTISRVVQIRVGVAHSISRPNKQPFTPTSIVLSDSTLTAGSERLQGSPNPVATIPAHFTTPQGKSDGGRHNVQRTKEEWQRDS